MEAAAAFHRILTQHPPAGLEADTRRRLADTLDILGQTAEAAAERELIGGIAMGNGWDPIVCMSQGDLLQREHQSDEACAAYERALRLLPPLAPAPARAFLMAKLSLTHHEASRPAKSLLWAAAALASEPDDTARLVMHRMAGVAHSDLGDLEQAEAQYIRTLELAELAGSPAEVAQSLTMLATVQHKRGQFKAAIATAQRSTETFSHPGRGGLLVEAECLRDMGRFDEARAAVAAVQNGPRWDQPDFERRTLAMCSLTLAWIETNAGQPDAALVALDEARANLTPGDGDKLVLYCDAIAVRIHAELGQAEDARRIQESVESRLPRFDQDRAGLMSVYSDLAPAAAALGDFAQSRDWWHKYLGYRPGVIGLIRAHYGLGEALSHLGEIEAARESYAQAVAPGIDSFHARRAQARLDELRE